MSERFDGFALVGSAEVARCLQRTQRAFSLYCQRLPPRLAIIVINELLRERLDRLALSGSGRGPESPGGYVGAITAGSLWEETLGAGEESITAPARIIVARLD